MSMACDSRCLGKLYDLYSIGKGLDGETIALVHRGDKDMKRHKLKKFKFKEGLFKITHMKGGFKKWQKKL